MKSLINGKTFLIIGFVSFVQSSSCVCPINSVCAKGGCQCIQGFSKNESGRCQKSDEGLKCKTSCGYGGECVGGMCKCKAGFDLFKKGAEKNCDGHCVEGKAMLFCAKGGMTGCLCPDGQILNKKTEKCVTKSECESQGAQCKMACPENRICREGRCQCREGFVEENGKCRKSVGGSICRAACPDNSVCVNGGCQCKRGFFKDESGGCRARQCKARDMEFKDCEPCKLNCKDKNKDICAMICKNPGCYCKENLVKSPWGRCIPEEECPAEFERKGCWSKELHKSCGSNTYCDESLMDAEAVCKCKNGYYGNPSKEGGGCKAPKCQDEHSSFFKAPPTRIRCTDPPVFGLLPTAFDFAGPKAGCYCNKGYLRDREGNCIPEDECPERRKTPCEKARDVGMAKNMVGLYIPDCTKQGEYEPKQCHGSTGLCWCVRPDGKKLPPKPGMNIEGTRDQNFKCDWLAHKKCFKQQMNILKHGHVNERPPKCEDDGNFSKVQCSGLTGMCWCLTQDGLKMEGTDVDQSKVKDLKCCEHELALAYSNKGGFKPKCDADGFYAPSQLWNIYPYVWYWCSDKHGNVKPGTKVMQELKQNHEPPVCESVSSGEGLKCTKSCGYGGECVGGVCKCKAGFKLFQKGSEKSCDGHCVEGKVMEFCAKGGMTGCLCPHGQIMCKKSGKCVTKSECEVEVVECKMKCPEHSTCEGGRCQCDDGFVMGDDGTCQTMTCKDKDMQFMQCKPCRVSCKDKDREICTFPCVKPGCYCKNDMLMSPWGRCIPTDECPAKFVRKGCWSKQLEKSCGSNTYCDESLMDAGAVCKCKNGYYGNPAKEGGGCKPPKCRDPNTVFLKAPPGRIKCADKKIPMGLIPVSLSDKSGPKAGCYCRKGYLRDSAWECVPEEECEDEKRAPLSPGAGIGIYGEKTCKKDGCGYGGECIDGLCLCRPGFTSFTEASAKACDAHCIEGEAMEMCAMGGMTGCLCPVGKVMEPESNTCIEKSECKKAGCATMICPIGTKCLESNQKAQCAPTAPPATCKTTEECGENATCSNNACKCNASFSFAINTCNNMCNDGFLVQACFEGYKIGCQCDDAHALSNGVCIPRSECKPPVLSISTAAPPTLHKIEPVVAVCGPIRCGFGWNEKFLKPETVEYKEKQRQVISIFEPAIQKAAKAKGAKGRVKEVKFQKGKKKNRGRRDVEEETEVVVIAEYTFTDESVKMESLDAVKSSIVALTKDHVQETISKSDGSVFVASQKIEVRKGDNVNRNCPDCWFWNEFTGRCEAKKGDGKCFNLKCDFDSMSLDFSPALFALKDQEKPFGDSVAAPSFDVQTGRWARKCALGECGMTCEPREIAGHDGIHLVFGYRLSVEREAITIDGHLINMVNPMRASVLFECAYRAEVKVSSTEVDVHSVEAGGSAIQFGNLENGFTIRVFTDSTFQTELTTSTTSLFIGQPVFTRVEWKVTTLSKLAQFYVDRCRIKLPEDKFVDLIQGNCYADTFDVKQLQADKLVSTRSDFKFTSFTVGEGATSMKFEIVCNLKVCSLGSVNDRQKCQRWIVTSDSQCPRTNDDVAFAYRAVTFNN